jgi:photosystem II stability/assembly factor-like uncharacterized protein
MKSVSPAQPQQKFPQILSAQEVLTEKFLWQITKDGCLRKTKRGPQMVIEDVFSDNKTLLSSVFFLDDAVGWVGSKNGFILQTKDGGKSWKIIFDGGSKTAINHLIFDKKGTVGWAAADQGLLFRLAKTGSDWNYFARHLSNHKLIKISFTPDMKHGLLADAAGNLFFTDNAGGVWQEYNWHGSKDQS